MDFPKPGESVEFEVTKEHLDRSNKKDRWNSKTCLLATSINDTFPDRSSTMGTSVGHSYKKDSFDYSAFYINKRGVKLVKRFLHGGRISDWFLRRSLPQKVVLTTYE